MSINKKKKTKYKQVNDIAGFALRDMAVAYEYGNVKADKRVQLKIPDLVLKELDKQLGGSDRSAYITQLIISNILERKRFDPSIRHLVDDEQSRLDDLWDFLDDLEGKR